MQPLNAEAPIFLTLSGISTFCSFVHPKNAYACIVSILSGKETFLRAIQFLKALAGISFSGPTIMISCSLEQFSKAFSPIVFSLYASDKSTVCRLEQFVNAPCAISSTFPPIFTLLRLSLSLNASAIIIFIGAPEISSKTSSSALPP